MHCNSTIETMIDIKLKICIEQGMEELLDILKQADAMSKTANPEEFFKDFSNVRSS